MKQFEVHLSIMFVCNFLRCCLHCLVYFFPNSWKLSQTIEMIWHWVMWLCCYSMSGQGVKTYSWKQLTKSASKQTSNMKIFSTILQVSFVFSGSIFEINSFFKETIFSRLLRILGSTVKKCKSQWNIIRNSWNKSKKQIKEEDNGILSVL